MSTIYIHIGSPKTGTTTLQKNVFPFHKNIQYLDWESLNEIDGFEKVFYCDSLYDNIDEFALIKEALTERHKNLQKNGIPILYSRQHLVQPVLDVGCTAERIVNLFGKPKILLTVRNQLSAIKSQYLWSLRGLSQPWLSSFPMRDFNKYVQGAVRNPGLRGRYMNFLQKFDYGAIAKKYATIIGAENIKILLFEDLVSDKEKFTREFSEFVGIDKETTLGLLADNHKNPAFTQRQLTYYYMKAVSLPLGVQYLTRAWKLPAFIQNYLSKGQGSGVQLNDTSMKLLKEHYMSGNQYLVDTFGVTLARYGYPLVS